MSTWTVERAKSSLSKMDDPEKVLLYRMAAARGRRVPLSELADTFGLPPAASVDQDFPALSAFCKRSRIKPRLTNPVIVGDGENPWYWMSADDADTFKRVLDGVS